MFGCYYSPHQETFDLTVEVNDLRNSTGNTQFTLYNKDGTVPDEKFEKYYVFTNLPKGTYAVNILHDEDKDGKIDKGFFLPIEGIGFSNYQSIGLTNRPNFKKASFELKENKRVKVKVIYM